MKDVLSSVLSFLTDKGAEYGEIRVERTNKTLITTRDGLVEAVTSAKEMGAGIRALVNGAWGFSVSSSLEKEDLMKAAESAFRMARASSKIIREPVRLADVKAVEDRVGSLAKKDPSKVDISEKLSNLLEIDRLSFKYDPRIKSVTIRYADISTEEIIATTDGTYVEQRKDYVWNYCWVTGSANGIMASARDELGAHGYELFDEETPEVISNRVCKRVIQQLEAKTPKGGRFPAVIGTDIVGVLAHEALGHLCEADLTLAGSVIMGKIGEKIASDVVTIYDDALMEEGFGYIKYDDEGVPGRKTVLIEKGVLVGLMHNRETAAKMEVEPTGNARAQDFRVPPIIRMRNTCFERGDYSFEELLEDIKFGYYLEAFRGGQANLDGTFTVGVQSAFEIVNGELGEPVRNLGISGNTLETLAKIDACGKDFGLECGRCGKGQSAFVSSGGPHIRVKEITIGGY